MIVDDILALLKPTNARVSISQWGGGWGVYFSDGGTQLVGAMDDTMEAALDSCLKQARTRSKPCRREIGGVSDLIG